MANVTKNLDQTIDTVLFDRTIRGAIALCFENERPLQGLAGLLDWRFGGSFSNFLRIGSFTGKPGECVYLPIKRADHLYHLFFIGGGMMKKSAGRPSLPSTSLTHLIQNLNGMNLTPLGLSRSDFDDDSIKTLSQEVEGVQLWLGK